MQVGDVMHRTTVAVQPGTLVVEAARMMLAHRVSGLPVLDADGRLVGIVSEGDLLRRAELGTDGKPAGWLRGLLLPSSVAADYVTTHSRHVSGVMTHHPVFVAPDTELEEVAELMLRKHLKRLPVLRGGVLVGVVSRADLLRLLARKMAKMPEDTSDAAIGDYIKAEMSHARWVPRSGVKIAVQDQVVRLEGTIFSEDERQAVLVIAENAPGVKAVRDHLVFVDPGSGMAFAGDET